MADFHGTQEVVTDLREDGVLIMRINRPEKRNAINAVTSAAMEDIMNKAEKDKRVRVIVVTGTARRPSALARTSPSCPAAASA